MNRPGLPESAPKKGVSRKPEFLDRIAEAFVDNGFRRTTTAELARRCEVRENELYRIWPNKKSMFLDSLQYLFDTVTRDWNRAIEERDESKQTAAEQLIEWQAKHRGDSRLHRMIFSGLSEIDDPEICKALRALYRKFHKVLVNYIREHRSRRSNHEPGLGDVETAWVMIGLGSIFDIQNELGQGTMAQRRTMLRAATTAILDMARQGDPP